MVKRATNKNCQRLGSKKHGCVMHNLRTHAGESKCSICGATGTMNTTNSTEFETDSGKLVINSEQGTQTRGGVDVRPDTQFGDRVIDAKFPCKGEDSIQNSATPVENKSADVTSATMDTKKEEEIYTKIPGVKKADPMTPKEAEAKKGECECKKVQYTRS